MGARWLETDTLSNQDISSALAVGAYTADADRLILVQVFADQVAGNGDYVLYVTQQVAGAGSHYRLIPITTAAAASGVTAIAAQSGMIAVRSGDVLTVYLDGLAGDTTTPDTIVRWFELAALQPATADRTLVVDASGRAAADVTAISGDTTAADNLEAVLDGTGGVTLTIKKLTINNTDPTGVGIQVNAYDGAHIEGTNRGVTLQGGGNQALYLLSATAAATLYIEGPTTGGKGIAISSPSDGSSLPGASGIYIQTEGGHPAILIDFTDPADAIKVVNSDNGNWVLDDLISAINAKTTNLPASPAAVGSPMTLADDAITAAKYDETTAFPVKQADTGDSTIARKGSGSETLTSLATAIDGIEGGGGEAGSGAITFTYTLTSTVESIPIAGADVWATTDSSGVNVVASGVTDANGQVVFYLDAGTYYIWRQLAGWNFTNPDTEVVA